MTQNSDLRFIVTFGPDCRNDEVSFGTVYGPLTHYITSPRTIDGYDPQVSVMTKNCPVTCSLI